MGFMGEGFVDDLMGEGFIEVGFMGEKLVEVGFTKEGLVGFIGEGFEDITGFIDVFTGVEPIFVGESTEDEATFTEDDST